MSQWKSESWTCYRCGTVSPSPHDGEPPTACLQAIGGCGRDSEVTRFFPSDWGKQKMRLHVDFQVGNDTSEWTRSGKYQFLLDEFRSAFRTNDTNALEVALGTIATSHLQGDALWMYIVAPPSSLKTEILGMTDGLERVEYLSSLTPNSLVSGWTKEKDVDLLDTLDKRTLVVKDFTSTLEMNRQMRDTLFGILRDCFDGKFSKAFGNAAGKKKYDSKFNMLAAVTPAIEDYYSVGMVLGQRFLMVRMDPVTKDWDDDSTRDIDSIRVFFRNIISSLLKDIENTPKLGVPDDIDQQIKDMAKVVAILRTHVHRESMTREIASVPMSEGPQRLANQFLKIAIGIAMVRGAETVGDRELNIIRRVALDTIPSPRLRVARSVYSGNDTIMAVIQDTRMPERTVDRRLEDLVMVGVVSENPGRPSIFTPLMDLSALGIKSSTSATKVNSHIDPLGGNDFLDGKKREEFIKECLKNIILERQTDIWKGHFTIADMTQAGAKVTMAPIQVIGLLERWKKGNEVYDSGSGKMRFVE